MMTSRDIMVPRLAAEHVVSWYTGCLPVAIYHHALYAGRGHVEYEVVADNHTEGYAAIRLHGLSSPLATIHVCPQSRCSYLGYWHKHLRCVQLPWLLRDVLPVAIATPGTAGRRPGHATA